MRKTTLQGDDTVPYRLKCSISKELMRDPVVALDGYTYEREEIEKWFKNGNKISPITGALLEKDTVAPNWNLRDELDHYLTQDEIELRNEYYKKQRELEKQRQYQRITPLQQQYPDAYEKIKSLF